MRQKRWFDQGLAKYDPNVDTRRDTVRQRPVRNLLRFDQPASTATDDELAATLKGSPTGPLPSCRTTRTSRRSTSLVGGAALWTMKELLAGRVQGRRSLLPVHCLAGTAEALVRRHRLQSRSPSLPITISSCPVLPAEGQDQSRSRRQEPDPRNADAALLWRCSPAMALPKSPRITEEIQKALNNQATDAAGARHRDRSRQPAVGALRIPIQGTMH